MSIFIGFEKRELPEKYRSSDLTRRPKLEKRVVFSLLIIHRRVQTSVRVMIAIILRALYMSGCLSYYSIITKLDIPRRIYVFNKFGVGLSYIYPGYKQLLSVQIETNLTTPQNQYYLFDLFCNSNLNFHTIQKIVTPSSF